MASKKQEGATREIEISKLEVNRGQLYGLPKNPRFIRDERFEALKKSIRDDPEMLSLRELIVYPLENGNFLVIGGNMRLRACEELGYEAIPCKVLPVETPVAKLRAYVVKDNVAFGENDWDAFANEWDLDELKAMGLELDGIEDDQEEKPEVEEDDFNEEDAEPRCKRGDIWQLGEHRLMCGDSTDAKSVAKLMGGERADISFTSPPYGASRSAEVREHYVKGKERLKTFYDDHEDDKEGWRNLFKASLQNMMEHTDAQFVNVQMLADNKVDLLSVVNDFSERLVDVIIWDKHRAAPQMKPNVLNNRFEFIFVFDSESNSRIIRYGNFHGTEQNIIEVVLEQNEYSDVHKAVFPVALPSEIIRLNSKCESVLDLFGGTGTTLIACEQLGRKCFMMELSAKYCDVIISRWEQLTGRTAEKVA